MISSEFGINKQEKIFQRLAKLHYGLVQFVVFEKKFTSAPNCTRKSCDYVLIIYIKKI